jgi:hypothetical protein
MDVQLLFSQHLWTNNLRDLVTFMISAMLNKDDANRHVIMNFMRIWKINAEVKIIHLGVFLWHGVLTLQWKTILVLSMATNRGRNQTAKALSFLLTKMPNWWWPHQEKGLENAQNNYDARQKKMYIYIQQESNSY